MKFKVVTAVTHLTALILYITPINKRPPEFWRNLRPSCDYAE